MKAAFLINFIADTIIENEEIKVDHIQLENIISGNVSLGYIAFNKNKNDPEARPLITPIMESGELEEACCASCAARALFAATTGLPLECIETGKANSPMSAVSALIMASVLHAGLRNKH
ncbi:hypothetical protein ACED16_05335 [Enterobacter hormaechei]